MLMSHNSISCHLLSGLDCATLRWVGTTIPTLSLNTLHPFVQLTQMALPVFRAVGIGWFAVNCFSAMTYGGRLAILFTERKLLRSSDLR